MKRCTRCGKEKPYKEFFSSVKTKTVKFQVRNVCNECKKTGWSEKKKAKHRIEQRTYRQRYPERVAESFDKAKNKFSHYGFSFSIVRVYGLEVALEVYNRFQRKCAYCSERQHLTIHHIDNNGINNIENGKEPNNDTSNLLLLCRKCHGSIHGKQSQELRKLGWYKNPIGIAGRTWKKAHTKILNKRMRNDSRDYLL